MLADVLHLVAARQMLLDAVRGEVVYAVLLRVTRGSGLDPRGPVTYTRMNVTLRRGGSSMVISVSGGCSRI